MRKAGGTAIDHCWQFLRAVASLIRWQEWYDSKLPLLFVSFYHLCLLETIPASLVISRFASVTGFTCLYLAFGYLINDYSDRESDRAAGKQKLIASLPNSTAIILLSLIGLAGMAIPLTVIRDNVLAVGLTGILYFFAVFYSMPPLRFKERGVWGLVVSAVAQRSLPSLLVFAVFSRWEVDTCLMFLLLGLVGVRWILVHQVIDLNNDRRVGVSTFATQVGHERTQRITRWAVFPLEVAALAAIWAYEMSRFPGLRILPACYGVVLAANWLLWRGVDRPYCFASFGRQPLSDLYYVYWPAALALVLAFRQPVFWLILVFNVLWQASYLLRRVRTASRLVRLRVERTERHTT